MPQTLLIEYDNSNVDLNMISKNPEEALRIIIANQTTGTFNKDLFHAIIRNVMQKNDNNLKRLLYYYFETIDTSDPCFMMCINQINKDLTSPNEFVRSLVLKFVSKIDKYDLISLLIRGVKENLNYKLPYVRMNALQCLVDLSHNFDMDIEQDIVEFIQKETHPEALRVAFNGLFKLGLSFDNYLKLDYPEIVLETLVDKAEDIDFLFKCSNTKYNLVSFKASCKLLKKNIHPESSTENILRILKDYPALKYDFINHLRYVEGRSCELLELVDFFELEFSQKVIDQCFENAETHEFLAITEILYSKFNQCNSTSDNRIKYKVLLLNSMATFATDYCVFKQDMISLVINSILKERTEIVYAGLKFVYSCIDKLSNSSIIDQLIKIFSEIKQGKIFRLVFDIISKNITKNQYDCLLDLLLDNFEKTPFYLSNDSEVFLGTHICLCLAFMLNKDWDLKTKTIGVMLKFKEFGDKNRTIDISSSSTISLCVRSVFNDVKNVFEENFINSEQYSKVDFHEPINFNILKNFADIKKYKWENSIDTKNTTIQLSGLGDPLYVEATLFYNKYELLLDLLIINQTAVYLQNINLDFTYSKHLKQLSKIQPLSLQANSASTIKVSFSILESSAFFITASASFKYPQKSDYASKPHLQNLGEINLEVKEFLETLEIDFKNIWKDLEWENIYSTTIPKCGLSQLLNKIVKAVNGKVCDQQSCSEFMVANISCCTIQRTPILINLCFNSSEITSIEIRVRSEDGDVVKSVSNFLASTIHTYK